MRHLFFAALLLCVTASAARADIFTNKGEELAADIIANPAQFFFDFQKDMESTTPLPPGNWIGFNWHIGQFLLIPIPDPTVLNLSGKLKLHSEGHLAPGVPQLDVIGGYWDAGPLINATGAVDKNASATAADTKITDAKFNGYYVGAVMTSSIEPRTRLFWGYKYSQMNANLTLNKGIDFLGTSVSSFKSGYQDHFIFAGLEEATSVKHNWDLQFFYGLKTNDFGAKVAWYYKNFELGLNIYPESVFVVHPTLGWHINFGS